MKKTITVKANGRDINLKFGMNTLIDMEEITGKSIDAITTQFTLSDIRGIILACLRQDKPETTPREAGEVLDDLLDEVGMEEVAKLVTKGFEVSMGKMPTTKAKPRK